MARNKHRVLKTMIKEQKKQAKEEKKLQDAVEFLQKSGIRQTPCNTYYGKSMTSVALQFGVSYYTLRRRMEGVEDRSKAQRKQMKLTPEQESILEAWILNLGYRSVPWTSQLVREKASLIADCHVGDHWVYGFLSRHPQVKVRRPAKLDACRAQATNRTTINSFYTVLQSTIHLYDLKPENTYNMDEKGVQMGLGAHTRVLVDRNQKTIYMKTDGNRELVTLIECVCADGTSLQPLAIFKGKRTNAKWAQATNINASIASSPNGWTDAELGSLWLDLIFEPQTRDKLVNESEYRLLILDGHCSHCTLKFLGLAEKYKIIILCLPPHTTHVLQPCDVGVFGPLSTYYKKEVTELSKLNIPIRKENLLEIYGKARNASLNTTIIKSAFRKTGIHPLDPSILPDEVYAPSLTTTTQPAQPVPASLPAFINAVVSEVPSGDDNEVREEQVPVELETIQDAQLSGSGTTPVMGEASNSTLNNDELMDISQDAPGPKIQKFKLTLPEMPSMLPPRASRMELLTQIQHLRKLLEQASAQIAADHAQKILMDQENGQLRMQLFYKAKEKDGSRVLTSSARLLTHQETQVLFEVYKYSERMKAVHADIPAAVSCRAKRIEEKEKEKERAEVLARRQAEKQRKEHEKQKKATEKELIRICKEAEKEAEKARKAVEKEKKAAAKEKKTRERHGQVEQQARMKGNRHRGPGPADLKSGSAADLQCDKENTHLHHSAPQISPPSAPSIPRSHIMHLPSRSPFSSQGFNTSSQPHHQSVPSEHEMPTEQVFNLELVDPKLLSACFEKGEVVGVQGMSMDA